MNCFQNGIFLGKSQQINQYANKKARCELLSKWYLPREITAQGFCISNQIGCELLSKWYLPREITAKVLRIRSVDSCELLSKWYLPREITAFYRYSIIRPML